jgi:hypothetical protein
MKDLQNNPLRDLNNARNLPRDTPETDAKASPHIGFFSCATVPADFARQLERERDEARDMVEKFTEQGLDLLDSNRTLKCERDEARELAQQMSESNQVLLADVRFYRNAWEQLKEAAE